MRILVVRIGRAGDIIMTTAALSAIFDKYPDADITVLTGTDGPRLLKNFHSRLSEIWVWNRSGLHSFFDKRKILKQLAAHPFDIIFCFDTSKHILGLFKNSSAELNTMVENTTSNHCSAHYLAIVEKAAGTLGKKYFAHLPVDRAASQRVNDELMTHGISAEDTVIMLHPSYSGYTPNPVKKFLNRNNRSLGHRLWSSYNFSRLAELLTSYKTNDGSTPKIIIDLMPEEATLGESILQNCQCAITPLNVKPDFERYKALICRANLLVVPNTGPMHIAAAVDTKVVALFSNWNPEDCGPYMDPSLFRIIRAEDMSEPQQGLNSISPETVMIACKELLD